MASLLQVAELLAKVAVLEHARFGEDGGVQQAGDGSACPGPGDRDEQLAQLLGAASVLEGVEVPRRGAGAWATSSAGHQPASRRSRGW